MFARQSVSVQIYFDKRVLKTDQFLGLQQVKFTDGMDATALSRLWTKEETYDENLNVNVPCQYMFTNILVVGPVPPSNVHFSYHAPLSFDQGLSNFGGGTGILFPITCQSFNSTFATAPTCSSSYTTVAGGRSTVIEIAISGLTKGTICIFAMVMRSFQDIMMLNSEIVMMIFQVLMFLNLIHCVHEGADFHKGGCNKAIRAAKYSRSPKTMILLAITCHFMIVEAQFFSNKSIGQSNPVAGATNTITVTMVTDTELTAEASSSVTISGLIGAVATNPVTLLDAGDDGAILFSDGVTQGKGAWSSGTLTLTVNAGGYLAAGTVYTFGFQITNPSATTTSPTINIAASGSVSIASATMTKPGTALYGVANGANPLEVLVPSFGVKSIEQSTPVSGATNTLTVTLTANYHLKAGSTVTILGLTGSQTADNGALTVASTSGLLGTAGAWTQGPGQLVLTAAFPGTTSGTACEVTFDLTNTASSQASPAVIVVADIHDASTASVGSIAPAAMAKPGTALYGVANGADPFEVLVPFFTVKAIEQSTPFVGASNTLTMMLISNYDLSDGSMVTISGLMGSQTENRALQLASTSGVLGTTGTWLRHGTLILTAAAGGPKRGSKTSVSFSLINNAAPQGAVTAKVEAAIGSGGGVGFIALGDLTVLSTPLYEVANGYQPLLVVEPLFGITEIGQSTPVPSATNTISVTLTSTTHQTMAGSILTISGLAGSATVTGSLPIWTSTSGLHAASAPLIAATAALSAANIAHTALLSLIQVEATATAAATLVHTHIYQISMYIPRR